MNPYSKSKIIDNESSDEEIATEKISWAKAADAYSTLYGIALCNFVVPTRSVWSVILFGETGVVQRITYSFNYFFFTCFIYAIYC